MKDFLTLFKFQFRSQYGISLLKSNLFSENRKPLKIIGLSLVILFAFSEMIGLYTFVMWQVFSVSKTLGIPEITLTFGILMAGMFILIFGTVYILSGIFFAKDSEFLAVLPVKQQTIFASKFAMVLLGEYPFVLAMLSPPVLIYGIYMNCGIGYYLLAILCGLLLPIIPLAIAAFISLILMRIVSRLRRRSLFISIAGIVAFVGIFLANNLFITKFVAQDSGNLALNFVKTIKDLVAIVGQGYPPSVWMTRVLTAEVWIAVSNLALLLVSSGVMFVIVIWIARFIYQKGVQSQFETLKEGSKKAISFQSSIPVISICKNEFHMILRTPIYALNSFAGWVMGPLVVLMPSFTGALKDPEVKGMLDAMQSQNQAFVFLIMTGVLTFFAMVNPAPSSAISREGSGFWLLKSLPILPRTFVSGKLLFDTFISIGAIVIAGTALIVLFRIDLAIGVLSILCASLISYPMAMSGLLVDVMRPKLDWTNPQEAIKQNINVVFGMLTGLLVVGILGLAGYVMLQLNMTFFLVVLVEFVLASVFCVVLQQILFRVADYKFS
ncbi:MAG: hypothetical protein WCL54_06430 [Clostridia bacterium]